MPRSPNSDGKNNNLGIPKVASGSPISPREINGLGNALQKSTIAQGTGYRFTQTNNGTVLHIPKTHIPSLPWSCYVMSGRLFINVGHFFNAGDSRLVDVLPNEEFANGFLSWAGGTKFTAGKGHHFQGCEVFIEDDTSNYVITSQITEGRMPLSLEVNNGYYYITIDRWNGRQYSGPQEDAGWVNGWSTEVEGTYRPIIRFTPTGEEMDKVIASGNPFYPLCYIDEFRNLYQGVKSDIYHSGASDSSSHPYKVTIVMFEEKYYAMVAFGTFNNETPYYESDGLDIGDDTSGILLPTTTDSNGMLQVRNGTYTIFLDAGSSELSEGLWLYPDPDSALTVDMTTSTIPSDTEEHAYIIIAKIVSSTDGYGVNTTKVEQAVTGSLWSERFQCGKDSDVIYWHTRI